MCASIWEGRTLLHRETMSHLEEQLDPNVMLRVHRSAFVNWERLKAVRRDANGRLLAVLGKRRRSAGEPRLRAARHVGNEDRGSPKEKRAAGAARVRH